jgi:DNA-binding winged helix-turn-helix (wHTH) protein
LNSNAERPAAQDCRIGDWVFSPGANELRRGEERRKLEHRAARTLELLCRRRGGIVSQEEIIGEVWGGRAISANSVPVVISDLRQALGDNAREPRHIETLAKRGYRLLADPATAAEAPGSVGATRFRWRYAVVAALLIVAIAAVALWPSTRAVPLVLGRVGNITGRPDLDPLANAASELIVTYAPASKHIRLFRAAEGNAPEDAVTLSARLIIWRGRPTVTMYAHDARGVMIWMGMTSGDERLIPPEIERAMKELGQKIER